MLAPLYLTAALVAQASSAAPAPAPADFIDDVRRLFAVVTCQPDPLATALPGVPDPKGALKKAVDGYCAVQSPRFQRYRERWGTKQKEFLVGLHPAQLPDELVYPFGGGDLMSALTAFPDAKTITTLSLELAGDPRRLPTITEGKVLKQSLTAIAEASASTLTSNDSLSKNLSKTQRGELPGQLSMHLMGLALFDYEPVSVRFFRVEPDGALHYYTADEVKALDGTKATNLRQGWRSPDFSPAFANVEVQFVPKGQPSAPRRTFRHIAADLSNDGLAKTPGVLAHLGGKGRVAAMTKAASYLLWLDGFTAVRDYLVKSSTFMVSDSTGVLPRHWTKAGCSVETYGSFQQSFLGRSERDNAELRKAFAKAKKLPMRFGYPDGSPEKRSHLMVARCPQ